MARAGSRIPDARRTEQAGILLVLVVMAACLALVLERLVDPRPPLLPVAAAAVLAGWALSTRALRSVRWLPITALGGAALATWLAGAALHPGASVLDQALAMRAELLADPARILDATAHSGATAGPIAALVLAWTVPLLAARACRLGRPTPHAWGPMMALLVGGMAVRRSDDIAPLAAFSAGAMLLSVTMGTMARRRRWERRGVAQGEGVSVSITRHGWAATAATVTLAWALTTVAVGAPLDTAWRHIGAWWSDQGPGGIRAGPSAAFGESFRISDAFNPSRDAVARVSGARGPVYLRAVTHDTYTGAGWTQSTGRTRAVAAGSQLLVDASLELPTAGAIAEPIEVEVLLERGGDALLLPGQPSSVSIGTSVTESSSGPFLVGAAASRRLQVGEAYSVLTTVRHASGAALAAAPAADAAQLAPYLALDNVSSQTREEAARITAGAVTAYAKAALLLRYLRGQEFVYSTRAARPAPGSGQDAVHFFLFDDAGRSGFCEQFASTMAVMARSVGIPARLARGYAGGERIPGGTYRVRGTQAHAWAELFFPGFGWQVFEATPSVRPVIRVGGHEPVVGPGASPQPDPSTEASSAPSAQQGVPRPDGDAGGWLSPAPAGAAIALVLVLLLVAVRRWRVGAAAGPMHPSRSPGRLWGRLTRDAAKAGLAPEPSQTAYEFAGAVERARPGIGPEVRLLARAHVAEAYAGPGRVAARDGDLVVAWRRVTASLRRARIARLVRRAARG